MYKHIKSVLLSAIIGVSLIISPVVVSAQPLYGDVDGSGVLTAKDAALVLSYVLDPISVDIDVSVADVNLSGALTADDCAIILSKVLNNAYMMPVEGGSSDEVTSGSSTTVTVRPTTEATTEATTKATTTTTTTEATTQATTTTELVNIASEDTIKLGAYTFGIGQSESSLPKATSTGTTPNGTKWYSYSDDYEHYTQVGVADGKVVSIVTLDVDAVYDDIVIGNNADTTVRSPYVYKRTSNTAVNVYYDINDSNRIYGISLVSRSYYTVGNDYNESTISELQKQITNLTNAFRAQHGLYDLVWNSALADVAQAHAEDMVENGYFDHTGLDGTEFNVRFDNAGINYRGCSENIDCGYYSAESAVNGWITSSGHRLNLLSDTMEQIGVGCAYNKDDKYGTRYVQDFISLFN